MTGESETKVENTENSNTVATDATVLGGTETLDAASSEVKPAPKPNRAERRSMKKQSKRMQGFIKKLQDHNKKNRDKFNQTLAQLKSRLGVDEFNALQAICTIKQAEQKDAEGKVISEAQEFVNWRAFLAEAKNLLVLRKQARIAAGKRKKTTGRSSDRKKHRSSLKFLEERAKATIAANEPHSTVKV